MSVRDAPDRNALLREDDRAVLAVEHQSNDIFLGHLRQLLVEDLLWIHHHVVTNAIEDEYNGSTREGEAGRFCDSVGDSLVSPAFYYRNDSNF